MPRAVSDSVIVITGASSGIGRATALAFARRGASVVLAARRRALLEEAVVECEGAGGNAVAVPTDVTDEREVRALAAHAVDRFGRIDVWVNNAGVYLAGRFDETPPEAFRRVIETNFFGTVHGARAALAQFRSQGSGVLINNSSVSGRIGSPRFSAYVASKWAVRGFSEALRQELRHEDDIHVCVVLPASIDTPFFQHAANYTGRALKPLNPIVRPERVADEIVGLAEAPRREVVVGAMGKLTSVQRTLTPPLAERLFAEQVDRDHYADAPAEHTSGNLFAPIEDEHRVTGGWRRTNGRRRAPLVALVGGGLVVAAALRRRR